MKPTSRLAAALAALLLAAPAARAADAVQDVLKAMGIDAVPAEEVQAIQRRARERAEAGDHAGAAAQYKILVDREPTRDNYRNWVRALESARETEKLTAAYR